MKDEWRLLSLGSALIVLLTVAAYAPALRCGFMWDDNFYVTENYSLRSLEGLRRIWTPGMGLQIGSRIGLLQYYPLALTGFWVQYHLWGLHPFGYHLFNILLHAVNAALLWRVLRRLAIPGAWWAAAIFALHPVQVESVAWIAEFKNALSGLFSLVALLAFLRFRPLTAARTRAVPGSGYHVLALLLFVCALLTKTAVCCLPVVIAVLMWWKLDRIAKRDVLALVPWFVASLVFGLITVKMEFRTPGTSTVGWTLSIVQRTLRAGRATWFYAGKVFWPHPLMFIYPRWDVDPGAAWQYLFPVAAVTGVAALWLLRRRIGKGPVAAVLCFVAMLFPALGFFHVYFFRYSYVADHFQYLACIGLMTPVAVAGATMAQRTGQRGRNWGMLAGGIVLLALGGATWQRAHVYQDPETLWRDTLAKNPNAWMAHDNLGIILTRVGKFKEAIEHFESTLQIRPDDEEAHYNLALALWQVGEIPAAIEHWERALQLKPDFADAHNNLGFALMQQGQFRDAIGHFREALRLQPDDAMAHYNLGLALWQVGEKQAAIGEWKWALRIKPGFPEAHYDLGVALEQEGNPKEALEQYKQALRFKPDFDKARSKLAHLQGVK